MMPLRRARITAPESRAVTPSMPVTDERRLGDEQRHRLALHVGTHQSAVCVVMLKGNGTSDAATETSCLGETSM